MIEPSQSTKLLIAEIDTLSGNVLRYKKELTLLVEIAYRHNQVPVLEEISFLAKFLHKAFRLLQRTGREDENSQRLAHEFQQNIERIRSLLTDFLSTAPPEEKNEFHQQFLDLTPDALERLLALCKDLGWYKNYRIDTRRP